MVATKMLACTKAELESKTHAAATHTICQEPGFTHLHVLLLHQDTCSARESLVQALFNSLNLGMLSLDCQMVSLPYNQNLQCNIGRKHNIP